MNRGHVLLVGAGHANLIVLRATRQLLRAGIDVTVVDPDAFWYSGMAAATGGGTVHPGRDRVAPGPLAERLGARHVRGRVVDLDPTVAPDGSPTGSRARALLDTGEVIDATAVVVNVGSVVDTRGLPVLEGVVTLAKPTTGLLALRDRLLTGPSGARIVVVGAGASAVEIAANLAAGGEVARSARPAVTIVGPDPLVPPAAPHVREVVERALQRHGVRWLGGHRVTELRRRDAGADVVCVDGTVLPADHVVLATGLRAHPSVSGLGLGDGPEGMHVRATLQHTEHDHVLGAGDAIRFGDDGLPRLGVFAVRQAPVIVDNLVALHEGRALRPFAPASSFLTAIDLGGGDAVLTWRGRTLTGRRALAAKRLLDEWFLRRHRTPIGSSGRDWLPPGDVPEGAPEA